MKIIFCIALLLTASIYAAAQDEIIPDTVGVEGVFLAKDDGSGKAGEVTTTFLTTDIPIHCVVQLNSPKPATVKMNLVAVEVKGVKAETKVVSVSYTTNGKQDRVNFTGKPDGNWTVGKYRIDIFVDGKTVESSDFEIQEAVVKPAREVKAFQPTTPPKAKPTRRPPRN